MRSGFFTNPPLVLCSCVWETCNHEVGGLWWPWDKYKPMFCQMTPALLLIMLSVDQRPQALSQIRNTVRFGNKQGRGGDQRWQRVMIGNTVPHKWGDVYDIVDTFERRFCFHSCFSVMHGNSRRNISSSFSRSSAAVSTGWCRAELCITMMIPTCTCREKQEKGGSPPGLVQICGDQSEGG